MDDVRIFKEATVKALQQHLDALWRNILRRKYSKRKSIKAAVVNLESMSEWDQHMIDEAIIKGIRNRDSFMKERYNTYAESIARKSESFEKFNGSFKVAELPKFIRSFIAHLATLDSVCDGSFFTKKSSDRTVELGKLMDVVMRCNIIFTTSRMSASPGGWAGERSSSQMRIMSEDDIKEEEDAPSVPSRMRFRVEDKPVALPSRFTESMQSEATVVTVNSDDDEDDGDDGESDD